MTIEFEGKSPGKIWYAWQRAKSLGQIFVNKDLRNSVKSTALSATSAIGVPVAGLYLSPFAMIVPFLGPIAVLGVTGGIGAFMCWKTYKNARDLKNSNVFSNYIRQQEYEWHDRKKTAAAAKMTDSARKSRAFILKAGAVAGYALAALGGTGAIVGGLQYAGVVSIIPAAALTALTAVISLPAAIAIAATAIPTGIIAGLAFGNRAQMIASASVQKRPSFLSESAPQNDAAAALAKKEVTPSFTKAVDPARQAAAAAREEAEKKAAAARKAKRDKKF